MAGSFSHFLFPDNILPEPPDIPLWANLYRISIRVHRAKRSRGRDGKYIRQTWVALANEVGSFSPGGYDTKTSNNPAAAQPRCSDVMWANLRDSSGRDHRLCSVELD